MLGDCKENGARSHPTGPLLMPGERPISGTSGWTPPTNVANRHNNGGNITFMDGHGKWVSADSVPGNGTAYTSCTNYTFWTGQ